MGVPRAGSAAILAVGGSQPVVTADANGRIGVEKQMKLNMTCDHRIVYGAQAAGAQEPLGRVPPFPGEGEGFI